GAQGPDLSVFPSLALEQVEVLRDGASAQYGSDAIAGVINFGLKKSNGGGTFEAFAGEYFEGDGFTTQYSAQVGLPLTSRGFATLTVEWREADDTSRSVQREDAAEAIAAGYPDVPSPAQIWGSPKVDDDVKFVANLGISGDTVDFYLFGNYATRDVDGGFYYREPTGRSGVYTNDGGQTLLVGDLTGAGGCPTIALRDADGNLVPYGTVSGQVAALPANCFTFLSTLPGGFTPRFAGQLEDFSVVAGAGACPTLARRGADGTLVPYGTVGGQVAALPANCFTFLSALPGGFTPRFAGQLEDFSVVAGAKGLLGDSWHWDVSATYGRND